MARTYTLKRRAEQQAQTRQRIVEAAVELHSSVGPAATTISMVAESAGVQRHTFYAHFPDERSLLLACSAMGMSVSVASPQGYQPDPEVVNHARWLAATSGANPEIVVTDDVLSLPGAAELVSGLRIDTDAVSLRGIAGDVAVHRLRAG